MLRPSFARKILRARSLRGVRQVHDNRPVPPPSSLAARAEANAQHADPTTFPLYKPPPEEQEIKLGKIQLDKDGLPDMTAIHRENKAQISQRATKDVPPYDEETLRDFYKHLVISGAPAEAAKEMEAIEAPRTGHMSKGERRSLIATLATRLQPPAESSTAILPSAPEGTPEHVALTATLMNLAPEESSVVPLGVVSNSEWRALLDSFIERSDAQGAEILLSTMQQHGTIPTPEQLDRVLELYSNRGETTEVVRLISDFENAGLDITDRHRDFLIGSYLNGPKPNPEAAISILTASESLGRPFPQSSYNVVLTHLVEPSLARQPNSHSRALAWDLLAQMRLAAHADLSREVYTTMIRCCGDSADPQPERARDLWIEMTTEGQQLEPRKEQYDAIIRALGSTKADYLEAYDLLRQMLAKHEEATMVPFEDEDATRQSPWVPTVETFTALLEGTKRAGDLARARWVLTEVVNLARAAAFSGADRKGPNEELMSSAFMTYAAWNPPVTRSNVKGMKSENAEANVAEGPTAVVETENETGSQMPKTSAEALHEAELLFERVVHDARTALTEPPNVVHYPFSGVQITTRLLNSFLSVYLKHATYAQARRAYNRAWSTFTPETGFKNPPRPNGWTYLIVVDRCARGKLSKEDREVAADWGRETWQAYREWAKVTMADPTLQGDSPAARRRRWLLGLGERQIERMWILGIRLAALADDLTGALALLEEFVRLHPPNDLLQTYTPRVQTPGLTLRMADEGSIAEPHVPPHILFRDIDVLHQRLVRDEMFDGVSQVKFATTAYERSLSKRRRWRVRGAGVRRELLKRQNTPLIQ